ncbi:MAG: hypothetical protein ACOCP8_01900 [archaeon]
MFHIEVCNNGYYLRFNYYHGDHKIAEKVKLSHKKYLEIALEKYNGHLDRYEQELYFKKEKNANKFLDYLISRYTITKLSK